MFSSGCHTTDWNLHTAHKISQFCFKVRIISRDGCTVFLTVHDFHVRIEGRFSGSSILDVPCQVYVVLFL